MKLISSGFLSTILFNLHLRTLDAFRACDVLKGFSIILYSEYCVFSYEDFVPV